MGFFSKKKKETLERKLPEFPKFPELPKTADQPVTAQYQPSFQPQTTVTYELPKQEAEQSPQKTSAYILPTEVAPKAEPNRISPFLERVAEKEVITERPRIPAFAERPPMTQEPQAFWKPPTTPTMQNVVEVQRPEERTIPGEDKPVFVKIQQYREAMNNIEMLKQKVKEAEYILGKLEEIRAQEQTELANCQTNLNKIKEKLIEIDKKLFEV